LLLIEIIALQRLLNVKKVLCPQPFISTISFGVSCGGVPPQRTTLQPAVTWAGAFLFLLIWKNNVVNANAAKILPPLATNSTSLFLVLDILFWYHSSHRPNFWDFFLQQWFGSCKLFPHIEMCRFGLEALRKFLADLPSRVI